jgi:nucleotide-binding universal stress UspA family protein
MSQPVIVVGVDGSPESKHALLWAAEQARLTDAILRVVYAWEPPVVAGLHIPPMHDWEPLEEQAHEFPGKFADEVLGPDPNIHVTTRTVRGRPAQVLVDASAHADMLVIGPRGLGGLRGMVLGSTGHHCAAHARCPVVIVHPPNAEKHDQVHRELPRVLRAHK